MKPLPPTSSASAKARTASPSAEIRWKGVVHPARARAPPHQPTADEPDRPADERTERERERREAEPVARVAGLGASAGQRRQHQHRGQRDAVVEAALHVEALPDADRHERAAHDRLPERRVRRREDRGEQQRLHGIEPREDEQRDARAERDRERHADREQARRKAALPPQAAEVDPRRVGEEHEHERQLGEPVHDVVVGGQTEPPEPGAADHEPDRHEDHRGRDRRAFGATDTAPNAQIARPTTASERGSTA